MSGHDSSGGILTDSMDDALDAGLRAAFGGPNGDLGAPKSLIASLEETLGIQARVLLRDTPDDQTPIAVTGRAADGDRATAVGRYQLAGEIARGGVGVVLKGRDPDLGRDVAIKVLRAEHMARSGMVERFVEEAQIAAQLQHPGILPVYELGMADGRRPFFSMKLIKGRTLGALLAERPDPAQDRQRFLGIFEQVCQAVAYAHAKGVVHRDLKPSNVMVGAFGEVQVVDWGLAKVISTGGLADESPLSDDASIIETVRTGESAAQSLAGSVFGTPAYMSPEQARGEVDRLDERSDVFSLGAILCEILTGAPPFAGDRHAALRRAQEAKLADALAGLRLSDADAELVAIATRCLSPRAADRPRDAGVVAGQVSVYLASLAERVRTFELAAARAEAVAQQERRARRLTLALASVILLAVGIVSVGFFWVQQERRSREKALAAGINEAITSAAQLLGQATAAPVGESEPWIEVRAAATQIGQRLAEGPVDAETRRRAESFLQNLAAADRDRRVVERIEEVVITGATHFDKQSWLWMEEQLRQAFLDYNIDFLKLTPQETAARIRASRLAAQLADGLELWIATCGGLSSFGVTTYSKEQLKAWTSALYEADPDPFTTEVRHLLWGHCFTDDPERGPAPAENVRKLAESADFTKVRPRTLSWLATAGFGTGDLALGHDIFRRALLIYPDDLMLNFDYAFAMTMAGQHDKAIRSFDRCLALRPHSGGLWRSLGVALRETKDLEGSADALRRSTEHQADHAPTYEDLGITLCAAADYNGAIGAFENALQLNPDSETARNHLTKARAAHATTNPQSDGKE